MLTTLTDRKSRFLRCIRLEKKTADGVSAAIIEALSGEILHSITPDRGKEFARHAEVTKRWAQNFTFRRRTSPGSAGQTKTPTVCYGNFSRSIRILPNILMNTLRNACGN